MTPGPEAMPMTDTEKRMVEWRWDATQGVQENTDGVWHRLTMPECVHRFNATVAALRATLAERDRAQKACGDLGKAVNVYRSRAEASEAREAAARGSLLKYGRHTDECSLFPCNCGYAAALDSPHE